MAKRRQRSHPVIDEIRALIHGARRVKDRLTGRDLRRMHRIESELMTVAGMKTAMPSKAKVKDLQARRALARKRAQRKATL